MPIPSLVGLPLALAGLLVLAEPTAAQPSGSPATTESNCTFGMVKGETARSCRVPIPAGCRVALLPGTDKPWATISKGGNCTCRFDEQATDWKTTITGTCLRCKSPQCSARFSAMFDCSASAAPYAPQTPGGGK
jgi:hypothetical protein